MVFHWVLVFFVEKFRKKNWKKIEKKKHIRKKHFCFCFIWIFLLPFSVHFFERKKKKQEKIQEKKRKTIWSDFDVKHSMNLIFVVSQEHQIFVSFSLLFLSFIQKKNYFKVDCFPPIHYTFFFFEISQSMKVKLNFWKCFFLNFWCIKKSIECSEEQSCEKKLSNNIF